MESGKFNLISPTSLLLLTSLIFLCALLFPPFIYEIFINEEYKAFMNFYLLFVFFIDIIFFSIGLLLISSQNKTTISPEIGIRNFNSMLFIMSVLSLINLLYSIANISNYGIGLDDYITANASYYKNNDEIRLQGELFNFLCIVFFWNIFYFYLQIPKISLYKHLVLALSMLIILLSSIIRVTRGDLMPFLFGLGVIFVQVEGIYKAASVTYLFRILLFRISFPMIIIFIGFSMIRGNNTLDSIIRDLLAYTIASYNRFAYILNNELNYTLIKDGISLSSFLSFNSTFNNILGWSEYMGYASGYEVWSSEFYDVSNAGLDEFIIWSSVPGYIFADIGLFSPVFFLLSGLATGFFWSMFRCSAYIGISVYPWMAYSLFFWFGNNQFFDTKFVLSVLVGLCLSSFSYLKYKYKN